MSENGQANQPKSKRGGRRAGAGRPKGVPLRAKPHERVVLADLAKQFCPEALDILCEVARDRDAPASARVTAASTLLDRGYGRPMQSVELSGTDGDAIKFEDVSEQEVARRLAFLLAGKPSPAEETKH